ncbi:glycoside hydrolase family 15 protein, partial [Pseudomonadota bacterium]
PSVFAAILDINKGGHFSITPNKKFTSEQQYIKHTNVLETKFKTRTGYVTVTDFMPIKHVARPYENTFPTLLRQVKCTKGYVDVDVEFRPRFDYARSETNLERKDGYVEAKNHKESLFMYSTLPLKISGKCVKDTYRLHQRESKWFTLQYNDDRRLTEEQCENALKTTIGFWKSWVNDSDVYHTESGLFKSAWRDIIIRSGLILKLLIQDISGSICAAATTSLPEAIGGDRNYDYRFNWIRDAAFTVRALYKLGYVNEARKHLEWFMRLCTENVDPKKIQVMYKLNGDSNIKEEVLDHLSGYMNSAPVRIGNGAAKQKQHDIYGELVNVFYETRRFGMDISDREWKFITKVVDHVCDIWDKPDAGIWEVRGKHQHFVHSKLMSWVAIDRGLKMARKHGKKAPKERWQKVADDIKGAILSRGFNPKLNSFVQAFDSEVLDATGLLIPIMKLLPFDDIRVQGTVNAILQNLTTKEGLVYRYDAKATDDGFDCEEGTFLLCTFWLVDVLAYSGRIDEAKSLLIKTIDYASPTGHLAEEIDPKTRTQLGNYPQAYSHIGLINSALYIEKAQKKGLKALTDIEMRTFTTRLKNVIKETNIRRKAKKY